MILTINSTNCAADGNKISLGYQYGYLLSATAKDLQVLHNFINDALVIELEQAIKLKTADLRKQHKIKLPDAIIAATALVYDLTLITRNAKDFENIFNLSTVNPWGK